MSMEWNVMMREKLTYCCKTVVDGRDDHGISHPDEAGGSER